MQALFQRIERVAPLDVPVLIVGETGTGKELVARALHQLSARRDRCLEIVNAGALTRDLLLSELFGHERGAFTGALTRKEGLLALADRGTVFLDEVGELAPDAQAMLLRFVQHGEIRPVGSLQTRQVDVRLIAATHRDLRTGIALGTFREDLYYRLRRVLLEVPPLRARRDDIPLLVEHMRIEVNARHGLGIKGLTREALTLIENAAWPGNVRELEAVVEEAMILRAVGWIQRDDLTDRVDQGRDDQSLVGANALGEAGPRTAGLNRLQREALRLAAERREVRRGDLMVRCGISRELARRELDGLVKAGLLRRSGMGRGAHYEAQEESSGSAV